MGLVKELMQTIEDRGFGLTDKYVCSGCVRDEYLVNKFIRPLGEYGQCNFCKNDKGSFVTHRKVYPLDKLMKEIMPAIDYYFMSAYENIPFDNETKEYIGNVITPGDFVNDYLAEELKTDNTLLLDEMLRILNFEDRASCFEYTDRRSNQDLKAWNKFVHFVNNCGSISVEEIISKSLGYRDSKEYEEIEKILYTVLNNAREMNTYSLINTGLPLYRCVNYLPSKECIDGEYIIKAKEVGTAPKEFAASGRFNEKGDMMFYGASSPRIAKLEVGKKDGNPFTIGEFHTNKRIKVLDLSGIPEWRCPSAFDLEQESIEKRESFFFLNRFIDNISKPVNDRSDLLAEQYYKPIQVFMKYIKQMTGLYGIKYRSTKSTCNSNNSKYPFDLCYVLFVEYEDCYDERDYYNKLNKRKGLQLFMTKVWQED